MWILWNSKHVGEAVTVAKKLRAQLPDDEDAGKIISRVGQIPQDGSDDRLWVLRKKIQSDPTSANTTRQLAWALLSRGRAGEAEKLLRDYLRNNGDDADVWANLGKIQQSQENHQSAIDSFTKSLEVNPDQPSVHAALGKSYMAMRNLDKGVRSLEQAVTQGGDSQKALLPSLGKSLFYRGEYRRAAEIWNQAVAAYPDKPAYRYYEAEALFYAGDQSVALDRMRRMKKDLDSRFAYNFLVDNAVARHDYSDAIHLLEEQLANLDYTQERRVIYLAQLYLKVGRREDAIALLKRWSEFSPRDIWSLTTLASILRDAQRYHESNEFFERAVALNPNISSVYHTIARNYLDLSNPEKAFRYMEKALELLPDDPETVRDYAWMLYEAGEKQKARSVLLTWTEQNEGMPIMPVLLYHGLTSTDAAPMLAHRIHLTITSFDNQMKSLRSAGFESVNMTQVASWHAGKGVLPEKPVFITFDDARLDSFRLATPILAQYGYRATMFVPLEDVESIGSIGYANWDEIHKYKETGQWDFQAHGGLAHGKIPVDEKGRMFLYLVMPKWTKERGVESNDSWIARINADHELIKSRMKENIDVDPIGYAWPEGNFGQLSDNQFAIPNNMNAIKNYFEFAFSQNESGINARTQSPYFLYRYEPPKEMTGPELVAHITNNNPVVLAYRDLLRMAVSENRIREAKKWLLELKRAGVTPEMYQMENARIDYASGNTAKAYQVALQSFSNDPSTETRQLLNQFKAKTGMKWQPSVSAEADSQDRENLAFNQELQIPIGSNFYAVLEQGLSSYSEKGFRSVRDSILGGGLEVSWGDSSYFTGIVSQHSVSGSGDNLLGYSTNLKLNWSESFFTRFEVSRNLYGSVRAIEANIRERRYRVTAHFGPVEEWGLQLRGRKSDITDNNERNSYDVSASWPLFLKKAHRGQY
jgi:tetratricopeptide (TPR) repeat protein